MRKCQYIDLYYLSLVTRAFFFSGGTRIGFPTPEPKTLRIFAWDSQRLPFGGASAVPPQRPRWSSEDECHSQTQCVNGCPDGM